MALIEPWLRPERFQDGRPTLQTARTEDLELARAAAGFDCELDPEGLTGRGLLVARRR